MASCSTQSMASRSPQSMAFLLSSIDGLSRVSIPTHLTAISNKARCFLSVSVGNPFVMPSANVSDPGIHLIVSSFLLTSSLM